MKDILYSLVEKFFEKRAKTLKKDHPLGIQVNINSGVANGVLVSRTIPDCIHLIERIVLNKLEYNLVWDGWEYNNIVHLEEKITGCIFRIKTDNQLLTNSFWNFYKE